MSSRVGRGFWSKSALAEMMNPGVQKPHWAPPWIIQAICRGWRHSGVPSPSMVVTLAPSGTLAILVTQERTSLPSRITLQAPHWPCPQPILTPVSKRLRRKTSARLSSASTTSRRGMPLTTSSFRVMGDLSLFGRVTITGRRRMPRASGARPTFLAGGLGKPKLDKA